MESAQASLSFRNYIPPADAQRSKQLAASDAYRWAELRCDEPFMICWMKAWDELYRQPYKGITVDGDVIPGLYLLPDKSGDLGSPTVQMVSAAKYAGEIAPTEERRALFKPIDAPEWRSWINPEIYLFRHGLRLEEASQELVIALHAVMRASLSSTGYEKAHGCKKVYQFLEKIVNSKGVLNKNSYNFVIFSEPSENGP